MFVLGSIGCALSGSLAQFVIARIVQGMGGAMMTPVGRLVLVRTIDRRELVNAMAWVSIPAMIGPLIGPPLGGFITTYASWHWIFLINVPIGLLGIVLVTRYIENIAPRCRERFDFAGMVLSGTAVAGPDVRPVGRGLRYRALAGRRRDHRASARSRSGSTSPTRGGRRRRSSISACCKLPTFRASLVGGFLFRIGVGAHAVPAAAAAAGRLQPDAVPVRPDHVHLDAWARCS